MGYKYEYNMGYIHCCCDNKNFLAKIKLEIILSFIIAPIQYFIMEV